MRPRRQPASDEPCGGLALLDAPAPRANSALPELARGRAPLAAADLRARPTPRPRPRVPDLTEARQRVGEELGLRPGARALLLESPSRGAADSSRTEQTAEQTAAPPAAQVPEPQRDPDPRCRAQRTGGRTARVIADAFARGEIQALAPSARQEATLLKLCRCRTAAMGATHERCSDCDFEQVVFCSCGDRNCPLCLSLSGERWLRAELKRALPCAYFHLVLTLPPALRPLAQRSDEKASAVYGILFRAARSAIETTAREELGDPKARLAITEVLHTWNRHYGYHPHVHAIVSAGALSGDGERWLEASAGHCLLPKDALQGAYRRALERELATALRLGERGKRGGLVLTLAETERVERSLREGYQHVHSKAVLDPKEALRYLARYTARPGFSDARLQSYEPRGEGEVVYQTKLGEEVRCTREELVRRLLTHMLPKGFHRVRRYSLVAPRGQKERVAQAQRALGVEQTPPSPDADARGSFVHLFYLELGVDLTRCPKCDGHLYTRRVDPVPLGLGELHEPRSPT